MTINKKVVIVGPPGTGKTTLKKVFFEMADPMKLLKTSLDPTRGVNSNVYSLFDLNLGIFDLAGQENQIWFKKEMEIFNDTNLIICVLDINTYLKEIFEFIKDLISLYEELKLYSCEIVILLHKIDLIDPLYLQHKLKSIKEYFNQEELNKYNIKVYPTSIAKKYFFETYDKFSNIFSQIFQQSLVSIDIEAFQSFSIDLKIILKYDNFEKYSPIDLFHDLDLPLKEAGDRLKRLEQLGFVEFLDDGENFKLTERANFFRLGAEKNEKDEEKEKMNKILETLFVFSNLNSKTL